MRRDLRALAADEHDLLIVGGGIHGVAAAWDAAQRGLRTALVEAVDFGAGTSWNSLKTIHGGLRHLQTLDLSRFRESVRERRTLLRIAPRLVRPLAFVVPAHGHGLRGREALFVGLMLNDALSADRNDGLDAEQRTPGCRSLSRDELLRLVPGTPTEGLSGGALWHDAQVSSSERLGMGFVRAAVDAGAQVANHVEVAGFLLDGRRVTGVRLRDSLDGSESEVRARVVLNAAGPGMDRLLALAGVLRPEVPLLRAMNLVLKRPVVSAQAVGAMSDGRFLFLVPWRGRAIVGTAYEPVASTAEGAAERFLEAAARAFPWAELRREDVCLVHRGFVPGVDAGRLATRHLLLDHESDDGLAGLVSVQGVKYTTARGVAEEAVDLVCRKLGRTAPSRTAVTPLAHAKPLEGTLAERTRLAVREEMASSLADAVLRRLDLGTAGPPAEAELEAVGRDMAAELGWSETRLADERRALLETYRV